MALKRKTQTQITADGVIRGIAACLLRFLIAPAVIAGISYLFIDENNENRLVFGITIYVVAIFLIALLTLASDAKDDEDVYVDSDDSKKSS